MSTEIPDPVAAALARMWDGYGPDDADILRLRAALEAVLKAHRDVGGRCAWCRDPFGQRAKWPCGEYLAIRRELLSEEGSDDI